MIEFTFMGRRYGLFAARLSLLGMPEGDPVPAVQGDLEAAGYQPFTRATQGAPIAREALASARLDGETRCLPETQGAPDAAEEQRRLAARVGETACAGVVVTEPGGPRPYECTRANPCGNCAVCWD